MKNQRSSHAPSDPQEFQNFLKPKSFTQRLLGGLACLGMAFSVSSLQATNLTPPGGGKPPCDKCEQDGGGDSGPPATTYQNSIDILFRLGAIKPTRSTDFKEIFVSSTARTGNRFYPQTFQGNIAYENVSPVTRRSAASLSLKSELITASTFQTNVLKYESGNGAEYITDGTGFLYQVKTDSFLVDIQVIGGGTKGYVMKYYFADEVQDPPFPGTVPNLYTIPSGVTHVKKVTVRDGSATVGAYDTLDLIQEVKLPNDNGWQVTGTRYVQTTDSNGKALHTMTTYDGDPALTASTKLEVDTHEYLSGAPGDLTYERVRTISRVDLAADGTLGTTLKTISSTLEGYAAVGSLSRMVRRVEGYGSSQELETTYGYFNDVTEPETHGRQAWQKNPDGSWMKYEISVTPTSIQETTITPFKNSSFDDAATLSRVEISTITENAIDTVTKILDQKVSRTKKEFLTGTNGERIIKTTNYGNGDLTSLTAYHASGTYSTLEAGRVAWEKHQDGTATTYTYAAVSGGEYTVTTKTGAVSTVVGELDAPTISTGDQVLREYNSHGKVIREERSDIQIGLLSSWVATTQDIYGRVQRMVYDGDTNDYSETIYGCCGVESQRSRDGVTTTYSRDRLLRTYAARRVVGTEDITTTTSYTGLITSRTRSAGSLSVFAGSTERHLNGDRKQIKSPDANADSLPEATDYSYSYPTTTGQGMIVTMTRPDGSTSITEDYVDGRTRKSSGTAVVAMAYDYGVGGLTYGDYTSTWIQVTRLTSDVATTGTEWTKSYSDPQERPVQTSYPGTTTVSSVSYNNVSAAAGSRGRMSSSTDLEGVTVTYTYNTEGEGETMTRPMPNNSNNQIVVTTRDSVNDSNYGHSYRSVTTVNGVETVRSIRSGDGFSSKNTSFGLDATSVVSRTLPADGSFSVTSTSADENYTVSTYLNSRLSTAIFYDSNDVQIAKKSYYYDALGRTTKITDARTGDIRYLFHLESGKPQVIADAISSTTYTYDSLARVTVVDAPDTLDSAGNNLTNKTYTRYTSQGQIEAIWGDQTYTRFYGYDEQGRMTELRTYQNLAHGTEPLPTTTGYASTQWIYDSARGWLLEKNYNGESEDGVADPDYTYNTAGLLTARTWERTIDNGSGTQIPLITTYAYDKGYLASVTYNDTVTPDLIYTYDNFGRMTGVAQGTISTHSYTYDSATLHLDTETIAYDTNGDGDTTDTEDLVRVLDRNRDSNLRNTGWELKNGAAVDHFNTYTYDTASRLHTVDDSFTPHITGESFAFRYSYLANSGNLISSIERSGTSTAMIWESQRNILTDTTTSINGGGAVKSRHSYTVNDLGQRTVHTNHLLNLTQNIGYNARGEVVSSTTVSPTWPQLSNRTYSYGGIGNRQSHSEGTGGGLQTTSYTANALNQYTAVASQSPVHDSDGNLTSGHLPTDTTTASSLEWDAENRLIKVTQGNGNVIEYRYDYRGRRIRETQTGKDTAFVYDNWNMIHDYSLSSGGSPAALSRFTWGLDLSGSSHGAGGVGGLLSTRLSAGGTYTPICDGNGNITEYLSTSGSICLQLGYDVFGNTIHEGGHLASTPSSKPATRCRFSSKAYDYDTGLYYYGYRYYDPKTGAWLSRDTIEEQGGLNLYGFVENDPVANADLLGMLTMQMIKKSLEVPARKLAQKISKTGGSLRVQRRWKFDGPDYLKKYKWLGEFNFIVTSDLKGSWDNATLCAKVELSGGGGISIKFPFRVPIIGAQPVVSVTAKVLGKYEYCCRRDGNFATWSGKWTFLNLKVAALGGARWELPGGGTFWGYETKFYAEFGLGYKWEWDLVSLEMIGQSGNYYLRGMMETKKGRKTWRHEYRFGFTDGD